MLRLYFEEGVKRDRPFIERDFTTETEQVGYVDAETQIMRMLYAGENLMQYKRLAYDYPDGEIDVEKAVPDPTRKVGFDPADASFFMRRAKSLLESAKQPAPEVDKEKDAAKPEVSV